MWRVRRKLAIWDVVTVLGRTTHVPARGKTRKKHGSIFHRPPPHRPLLAGADNRALVEELFEAPKCHKNCVFEASKLVSTKTLLLKHYYRSQGTKSSRGRNSFLIISVQMVVPLSAFYFQQCLSGTREQPKGPKSKFSGRISVGRPGLFRADVQGQEFWSGKCKHVGATSTT